MNYYLHNTVTFSLTATFMTYSPAHVSVHTNPVTILRFTILGHFSWKQPSYQRPDRRKMSNFTMAIENTSTSWKFAETIFMHHYQYVIDSWYNFVTIVSFMFMLIARIQIWKWARNKKICNINLNHIQIINNLRI